MDTKKWILGQVERTRERRDLRWRQLPHLKVHPSKGEPSVYYLSPVEKSPSGGIKVIYRHVDALNALGIPAAVVHNQDGFRCEWFDNRTRVISAPSLHLKQNDLLVLPECYGPGFGGVPSGVRVVVFNQGPHRMFDRIPLDPRSPGAPYSGLEGLEGILTVSQDGADMLRAAIPDVSVAIARNVIDENIFHPNAGDDVRRISYVPSRRAAELQQLLHLLHARPEISSGDWQLQPLYGLSERRMADALRNSTIFLSLSDRDGFGLPPAEAMACGSYVVGYPGGGGGEFFESAYCSPAHDTTEVFMALIEAMRWPEAVRQDLGAKASARILGHYTQAGLKTDLLAFYGGLL